MGEHVGYVGQPVKPIELRIQLARMIILVAIMVNHRSVCSWYVYTGLLHFVAAIDGSRGWPTAVVIAGGIFN